MKCCASGAKLFTCRRYVLSAILLICITIFSLSQVQGAETEVGWIEKVCLNPGGVVLAAKVDTGAVSCSLHAPNKEEFYRNGKKWVRFTVADTKGKEKIIESQIVGTRQIKRHFGKFQIRPVVRLNVCLGNVSKTTDVNLVDRTGFEFPMLIGRDFMKGLLTVNPSSEYTVEPACAGGREADSLALKTRGSY